MIKQYDRTKKGGVCFDRSPGVCLLRSCGVSFGRSSGVYFTEISNSVSNGISTGIFCSENNSEIGFEGNEYKKFQSLIESILTIKEIDAKASQSFIENEVFEWILQVKKKGAAEQSVLNHIKTLLDINIKHYEFYFPIVNLNIEHPFKLGNVEFTFFTKEYMDELFKFYQTAPSPISSEQFDDIFRKEFQGVVIAKTSVNAERGKAEILAKKYSEQAVDCLKILGLITHSSSENTFELNYRLNYPVQSRSLQKEKSSLMNYGLNMNFENSSQFTYGNELLQQSNQNGFDLFSSFITLQNTDEMYRLLMNSIDMLSFALSIADMHKRAVALITILESLMLEDDRKNDMVNISKNRLCKIIGGTVDDKERLKTVFSNVYQIRHKMVHKAIRLSINSYEITQAQVYLIRLILRLCEMNMKGLPDKITLFTWVDAQPI